MIKSLSIRHFRCFESLDLHALKRINVVVGPNGSGKSAFLEALLLGARAHPDVVSLILGLRNSAIAPRVLAVGETPPMSPQVFSYLYSHLFSQQDTSHPIEITLDDATLRLSVTSVSAPLTPASPNQEASLIKSVEFERKKPGSPTVESRAYLNERGRPTHEPPIEGSFGPLTLFFGATSLYSDTDNATWLSTLTIEGRSEDVNRILSNEFPQIKEVSPLVPHGVPEVWSTLRTGERRPLSFVSTGITKFLTLTLGTMLCKNGVVLIDELENGIYYARYKGLWRLLNDVSLQSGAQLFVTTHSYECLQALLPIATEYPSDVQLIRFEPNAGLAQLTQIPGIALRDALSEEGELRGHSIEQRSTHQ